MLNCRNDIPQDFIDKIQILEHELRPAQEAKMEMLEMAYMEALNRDIPLTSMRVVEVTEWCNNRRKFVYSIDIHEKPETAL